MRTSVLALLGIAMLAAAPAVADGRNPSEAMSMGAPSLSETDQAEPDWFQSFTTTAAKNLTGVQLWETEPARDINLQWVKGDRWQLNIDVTTRSEGSPLPREEVSAGATFRLTPRITIGGAVSIGADELERESFWDDEELEAGIRLQSAFKF